MMDTLITVSLVFPWLAMLAVFVYVIWKYYNSRPSPLSDMSTSVPPTLKTTTTTIKTPDFNNLTIDESEWDNPQPEPQDAIPNSAHRRIYRVYRSINRSNWVQSDPVLTERAACNYGAYIKANNPTEYVRVEDPEGMILFYE